MDKHKILSGDAIVAKGVTKQSINLPEVGLKSTIPDGSWLELKRIQTALEARKCILGVERIEKVGSVAHAVWRDDLQLAEVTQKVGGCWQYFGHNVGKTLYLRPEEVLFLMEVNCLLLKHNEITVSLQKAYSLVLNDNITLNKYKVYASLSRIGYKVYRHKIPKEKKEEKSPELNINQSLTPENIEKHLNDIVDKNILEQRPTEIPVLDSKTYDFQSNVQEQVPTEVNNGANDDNIIVQKNKSIENGSSENTKIPDQTNDVIKLPCAMEVEEIKSDNVNINESKQDQNIGSESLTTNTNPVDVEDNVDGEHTNAQSTIVQNNDTENTGTDTNECEMVMEVVDKENNNKESAEELAVTSQPVSEEQSEIIENMATPNVKASTEESNANNSDVASEPTAMDISDDCCQAAADSTVHSIETDDNENIPIAIAVEVDTADLEKIQGLGSPKHSKLTNDKMETEIEDGNKGSVSFSDALISNRQQMFQNYVTKFKKLSNRQCKPSDFKTLDKHFEKVPDLFKKQVIVINVPEQQFIPKNIFVNKSNYTLNIKEIRMKTKKSTSADSTAYSSGSDEVNGNHVRRLRSISSASNSQYLPYGNNTRFPPPPNLFYRPYTFWRPQNNLNYVQFNMFFQRPFSNVYFHSRLQGQPRAFSYNTVNNTINQPNDQNTNSNNQRKRKRNDKTTHLQSIKNLAFRLKQLILDGGNHIQNTESLHRLLYAYNTRYKARLRLTEDFEVINDETILETIDLEDDGESRNKRSRLSQDSDKFDENLNLLRQLALKLKNLVAQDKATSKHRRAMSKAIKTFKKSYDADIYMNSNFEVIDKRFINIESDSESDCAVSEPKKVYKSKKLRNPFNILKRRSEQQVEPIASTSGYNPVSESNINNNISTEHTADRRNLLKIFNENWLPPEDDFGRAEVVHKHFMNLRFMETIKEQYLINFVKSHLDEFNNWLEAKLAFVQHMEDSDVSYENEHELQMKIMKESIIRSEFKSLLDPGDCLDTASALEKLRIIKNNTQLSTETTLIIDFDVYKRDIVNFKKTSPPPPNFRLICLDESSSFPSSADIVSLYSKYTDSIPIVFAVVGISSVSYLQFRPIDIPVYVASNDLD